MIYAGYDIGGTKCAVSLGRVEGDSLRVLAKLKFPTEGGPEAVIGKLAASLLSLLSQLGIAPGDVRAAGISCGGPLDSRRGLVLSPPNLPGWDEMPVVALLEEKTGIPTRLQNDANACAVAEWKFGAGRGTRDMAFLTFGTGLGAGLILDGKLYSGASDMAGEVGHVRLAEDGPMGYEKCGSAEGFCSGGGIARTGILYARRGEAPRLLEAADGAFSNITAKLIAQLADAGDGPCLKIYADCGRRLGMLLSFLMDIVNPELIVLGGVFMRSEALIRPSMEAVIAAEALPHAARACRVVPAGLGEAIGDYAALSVGALEEER